MRAAGIFDTEPDYTWRVWWSGLPGIVQEIRAKSRGKAKSRVFRQVRSAGYSAKYTEIFARKVDVSPALQPGASGAR